MNRLNLSVILGILLIGIVSAQPVLQITQTQVGDNISINLELQGNTEEVMGYTATFYYDESKVEPSTPIINDLFTNGGGAEIPIVRVDKISIAVMLWDISNAEVINGNIGQFNLRRLTNDSITLLSMMGDVGIILANGTFIDLSQDIIIPEVVVEEPEPEPEQNETQQNETIETYPIIQIGKNYDRENVTLIFSLNDNDYNITGWTITYKANGSEIESNIPMIPDNSVFSNIGSFEIEMLLPYGQGGFSMASTLQNINNPINVNGILGSVTLKRLSQLDSVLIPMEYNVGINLANGTYFDLGQTISIEGYAQSLCTPNWVLGNYGSCSNGQQTASYSDTNSCGLEIPTPKTKTDRKSVV